MMTRLKPCTRMFFGEWESAGSIRLSLLVLTLGLMMVSPSILQAQNYDLLLKGGHLIDPKNEIDRPMDVAVSDGMVARIAESIPESQAGQIIDASGLYVTPGLIDIHSHNYHGCEPHRGYSGGFSALPPDGFTFRAGVTTVVDVGGAGWTNFLDFREQVIERSRTRVLAFINIVGDGMSGIAEQHIEDMHPRMAAEAANRYDEVVGVKIAHFRSHDWEPYYRTVEAAEMAEVPVMVDFGGANPPLSLKKLLLEVLRPGDIYTHAYGKEYPAHGGRESVVLEDGTLRDGMLEARDRGIIFDVGHGGGSFFYEVAVPAIEQGLYPQTLSTDIHIGSMNGGMKDMANVVSKFLNLGMSIPEVIKASTWKPAQVIQREDLGHLSEGAVADIALFKYKEGDFGFLDSDLKLKPGSEKLQPELTLREGRVVWDLNGLASSRWDE